MCASFGDVALAVLRDCLGRRVDAIDDVAASLKFERAGAALFALDWTEFVTAEIDPEIPGLRTPERFAAAAFRLIRKLRSSLISPDDFRSIGLRGAATFYANPPNFADAALLQATPAKYRDSLRAHADELERQRRREVDLVQILARLYASYVEVLIASGCLTPTDAVFEAALALRASPEGRRMAPEQYAAILVDDAQDLSAAHIALLEGIAAQNLANVTFAGDPAQSTRAFAGGGRGSSALRDATMIVELAGRYRCSPAVEGVAALVRKREGNPAGISATSAGATNAQGGVREGLIALYRASDMREEARYVACEIARRIALGTPPEHIGLIARSLRCSGTYVDALLARGITRRYRRRCEHF